MKPSWEDCPSWASYLAKGEDGEWLRFEEIPEQKIEKVDE